MKPNLFDYATSELSQDAFLCWLLAWAHPENESVNSLLHRTGFAFLNALYLKAGRQPPNSITSIEIKKQDGAIDVHCIVNGDTVILIEDKINTSQHSNQLKRYKDYIINKGYSKEKIIPVYMKTGDQGDFTEVLNDGYVIFKRNDFLNILESAVFESKNVLGDIFCDFTTYLRRIENEVQSYATTPIADGWTGNAWRGFLSKVQEYFGVGKWDYVNNPSGGFFGYWWCFHGDAKSCEQYLQLESQKFCFKISVADKSKIRELRDFWNNKIIQASSSFDLKIKKPDRFGLGAGMTVAVLDGDYRKTNKQGLLDFPQTIAVLRTAEKILKKSVG